MEIIAYHNDMPGSPRDLECNAIFERHGGVLESAGMFLPTRTRDMSYDVPGANIEALLHALSEAGFAYQCVNLN
jgi:hypothetical protein